MRLRFKALILAGLLAGSTLGGAAAASAVPEVDHPHPHLNVIIGTFGPDFLWGTHKADLIFGLAGADRIFGNRGNDILRGGLGRDRLFAATPLGHSGRDIVRGGFGFDTCTVSPDDIVTGCEVTITLGS